MTRRRCALLALLAIGCGGPPAPVFDATLLVEDGPPNPPPARWTMEIDARLGTPPRLAQPLVVLDDEGRARWRCAKDSRAVRLRCFERPEGPHAPGMYALVLPDGRRAPLELDGREVMLILQDDSAGQLHVWRAREHPAVQVGPAVRDPEHPDSIGFELRVEQDAALCAWAGFLHGYDLWDGTSWRADRRREVCQCGRCGEIEQFVSGRHLTFWSDHRENRWVRAYERVVEAHPEHGCDHAALMEHWRATPRTESFIVEDVWVVRAVVLPSAVTASR